MLIFLKKEETSNEKQETYHNKKHYQTLLFELESNLSLKIDVI